MLGELSVIADLSLSTNHPENLQQRGVTHLQRTLKDKVAMMGRLQSALDRNAFTLMVQPVRGCVAIVITKYCCGCRIRTALCSPRSVPARSQEFGLSSRVDLWVLERTLRFLAEHRDKLPGQRFAINLAPSTVCRAQFPLEVSRLLAKYGVEAWQLIFEVTECSSFGSAPLAIQTLRQLQQWAYALRLMILVPAMPAMRG
jgi:EAL domain-containing protein (putative c-di-GMP-specific phosphodiesterase class I)